MLSDVVELHHFQTGAVQGRTKLRRFGQRGGPERPACLADQIRGVPAHRRPEQHIGDDQRATGSQGPGDLGEGGGPVADVHHGLDRPGTVEGRVFEGQRAGVRVPEVHAVGERGGVRPGPGEVEILVADGDSRHLGAGGPGDAQGGPSGSAADVQQAPAGCGGQLSRHEFGEPVGGLVERAVVRGAVPVADVDVPVDGRAVHDLGRRKGVPRGRFVGHRGLPNVGCVSR